MTDQNQTKQDMFTAAEKSEIKKAFTDFRDLVKTKDVSAISARIRASMPDTQKAIFDEQMKQNEAKSDVFLHMLDSMVDSVDPDAFFGPAAEWTISGDSAMVKIQKVLEAQSSAAASKLNKTTTISFVKKDGHWDLGM